MSEKRLERLEMAMATDGMVRMATLIAGATISVIAGMIFFSAARGIPISLPAQA
ncbi:hypothetical protein L1047_11880 [Synechococcus sp. Nb3U1]|uniref:hypothetical protein n=1 Tax=Synechococcus sp. Nb3U1 TaxID=1914529 RepID=UPI001F1D002B|nr:hypothetical protein [Synechococcus sp. Nb3U1]MCF2971894.1 hypothetical protein [Synechococcus sp. Nb3U1]